MYELVDLVVTTTEDKKGTGPSAWYASKNGLAQGGLSTWVEKAWHGLLCLLYAKQYPEQPAGGEPWNPSGSCFWVV